MLAGILLLALSLRLAVSGVSPVLADMAAELPFGTISTGVLGMLPTAAFAAAGFAVPVLLRRFGLELLLLVAILLAAVGQLGRALAPDVPTFLVLSGVTMAGYGMGNILLPPLVKRYFPDRIGLITALYVTLLAVSTAFSPLLAVPLEQAAGWRFSIGVWAAVSVAALVPWLTTAWAEHSRRKISRLVLQPYLPGGQEPVQPNPANNTPSPIGPVGPGGPVSPAGPAGPGGSGGPGGSAPGAGATATATVITSTPTATSTTAVPVWRSPLAWGLALVFAGTSSNTFAMFTWLPPLLVDSGMLPPKAGTMLAYYAILALPTSLLVPLVAARLRNPLGLGLLFIGFYAAGYAGLLLSPSFGTWLWITLAGLGQGTFALALLLVNLRTRTTAGAGALSGFAQGIGYTVACAGPLAFGLLHDVSGGWGASFGLLGAALLLLAVGLIIVGRPRYLEDLPQLENSPRLEDSPAYLEDLPRG
ncbi:MFS transporter [Arthrobacter sp. CAU 1506]|uniref:MFS transporter n=1 Tax=Arthrobacter sp. CAU 1506 TaxID=2560052 RepID=UPI0010AD4CE9|nr:MFS transporter [Arthrobacter sp. CAU 1506]TJY69312.1 MFS transporter [Arthrobacter sp. CAU 1506]